MAALILIILASLRRLATTGTALVFLTMDDNLVFSEYLRAGLFEIGDADNRLEQLSKSVEELAGSLANNLHQVRCYTLVALDAHIPLTNPLLLAAQEVVKKHWKGLEGKYPQPPVTILRGVILSALYQLGRKYMLPCRVIYYTASGLGQFIQFGREKPAIDLMLLKFADFVENEALKQWELAKTPIKPTLTSFELNDFKLGIAKVDATALEASLKKAAGPEPVNSYSTQSNSALWVPHFASTASAGIAKVIESSLQTFGQSLSTETLEAEINEFFAGISASLSATFEQSFQSLVAVERRSKLLWWKETLFSTTLRKSYREIDPAVLPVVMAIDLAQLLPDVAPVSVDYLLTDTYRAIVGAAPKKQPLPELLAPFGEDAQQELLAPHLKLLTDCGGRTTLTAFLAQVVHGHRSPKKLTDATGLRAKEQASPAGLAVLVLHDLLTERLIKASHAA